MILNNGGYMETKTVTITFEGFNSLLFITFLVLKLCGVINWSWGWVTAPLWMPIALIAAVLLVIGLVFFIIWLVNVCREKHYERLLNKSKHRRF